MILAALLTAATPLAAQVDAIAARSGFAGVVLVARGDRVLVERGYGTVRPGGGARHYPRARWRLASITKQVTAALLLRRLHAQDRSLALLDRPIRDAWGTATLDGLTWRQLLTHHTGLANPDDFAGAADGAMPGFYTARTPDIRFCLSKPARPGAAFAYNNCDYIVAHALQATTPHRGFDAWPAGMRIAAAGDTGVPGFVGGAPEPAFNLATFGAAGGLTGTARDVLRFDRALMTGRLLPRAALAELWKPEGSGSYQALGQWVFPGSLKGCATPKRIVQRDGEIQGVQARNFILPDDDLVVIAFTNRSSDDFAFGEIWRGEGFSHDLLSAAACT